MKAGNTNLLSLPINILKASRPLHWVKNLSLFAAIIFSGDLLNSQSFVLVVIAFIAFGFVTSSTYIFNDIRDAKRDRLHPFKKNRPIASGNLRVLEASFVMVVFALISLYISSNLGFLFFVSVALYLIIQIAYSLGLKNLSIIDILLIASGFVLRVYAGAFVIDAHLSVWFLLCVISVALFLAAGKRRAELGAVWNENASTRKSLSRYSKNLLDSYVTMFGNAAWLSWALFTFFESPPVSLPVWLFLAEISRTTTISKLMMITIPIVIFGIMRYESIIFEDKSESPEKLLLKDIPLVSSMILWLTTIILILYFASSLP